MTPRPPAPGSLAPGLPLSRRPAHRRLLAVVALAVMLIAAAAPAVSAEELINDDLVNYVDTSMSFSQESVSYDGTNTRNYDRIYIKKIENQKNVAYFALSVKSAAGMPSNFMSEGRHEITYTIGGITDTCVVYCQYSKNSLGSIDYATYLIFPQNWNIGTLTGKQYIVFSEPLLKNDKEGIRIYYYNNGVKTDIRNDYDIGFVAKTAGTYTTTENLAGNIHTISATSAQEWRNNLLVETGISDLTRVVVTREYDGQGYESIISLVDNGTTVFQNGDVKDFEQFFPTTTPFDTIVLTDNVGKDYTYYIGNAGAPSSPATATVYVRNSQTGALLADAHIEIQDTTTDPWTEVVNQTLPSGQGTISLPKDPGIHFTQYHIGATVPGYQQVVPALFFRVTGPTNIVVEMEPTAGGPEDPNNAYLEFYVRDIHANGIPNANVLVDGKTRWTNGQGYTQFEVVKNGTYPYTVSKSGYMTIQGSAIVADGPRYVANVVLGPGTVPTHTPTIGPGETPGGPGATPTPDTRTNEQKGQAIIDLIADFAEPIAILAILATIFGLMKMMTPGRR